MDSCFGGGGGGKVDVGGSMDVRRDVGEREEGEGGKEGRGVVYEGRGMGME